MREGNNSRDAVLIHVTVENVKAFLPIRRSIHPSRFCQTAAFHALPALGKAAGRLRVPARWLLAAAPLIAFATVNAAAFAATQKLVHIRYALAAHTICISVVYLGALAWAGLLSPPGEQHR